MIKLYGNPISGNSHRVSTFLSILGVENEFVVVDLKQGEHKNPAFLAMNPLGQIPVLIDGDLVLRDSAAILVYLARKFDKENRWYPIDAAGQATVQQWLTTAAHDFQLGPVLIRAIKLFGSSIDFDLAKQKTENLLGNLFEPHLANNQWLTGNTATIADIACYGYIARVTDGDFSLAPYPNINEWLAQVEAIDGFAPMIKASDKG